MACTVVVVVVEDEDEDEDEEEEEEVMWWLCPIPPSANKTYDCKVPCSSNSLESRFKLIWHAEYGKHLRDVRNLDI